MTAFVLRLRANIVRSGTSAALILFVHLATVDSRAQSAPTLLSVTPADGAVAVATNSSVVFMFSQEMKTQVLPFPTITPALVGNYEFQPTNLLFNATWGADKRTLTFKPTRGMPYDATISWTLNPPGGTLFPQFSNASGQLLATVSGTFHTAAYVPPIPPPTFISMTPTNGATQNGPRAVLVLTFDQEMDTNTVLQASTLQVIGNYTFSPAPLNSVFTGSWSADKRKITFTPAQPLALSTMVYWSLNPIGSAVPLKNSTGQLLASVSGNYQVITDTGGNPNESCFTGSPASGYYSLIKTLQHLQTNASDLATSDVALSSFDVLVRTQGGGIKRAPKSVTAGTLTNASITLPGNRQRDLQLSAGAYQYSDSLLLGELDTTYPAGLYTLRFNQSGEPERVVPLEMPPWVAALPRIANFDEAQAIDPALPFTLRWDPFTPQAPGAFIEMLITDESGKTIFRAPNPCVSRTLNPADASTVIPATYLRPGLNYHGVLRFGQEFYHSTNDVPQMSGTGIVMHATSFVMGTLGSVIGGGGSHPPEFTGFRLLAGGIPELTLTGTYGKTYSILRSATLTNPIWSTVGTVTPNLEGNAVFQEGGGRRLPPPTLPVYYRAREE